MLTLLGWAAGAIFVGLVVGAVIGALSSGGDTDDQFVGGDR